MMGGGARAVGYPTGRSVHLHYGKFAARVAQHLGLTEKPLEPGTPDTAVAGAAAV